MFLLEDGEQYIYDNDKGLGNVDNLSLGSSYSDYAMDVARKPLTFPPECKRLEGFLTLFDDHELRSTPAFEQAPKWQRHSNIGGKVNSGTTLWRRLWFRAVIVDDTKQQDINDDGYGETPKLGHINIGRQKTIVLRYWLYPEHAEQQREVL